MFWRVKLRCDRLMQCIAFGLVAAFGFYAFLTHSTQHRRWNETRSNSEQGSVAWFGFYAFWVHSTQLWRWNEIRSNSEQVNYCDVCNSFPAIDANILPKCKSCFKKVTDETPEAYARNKLLLEYYEQAQKATTRQQRLPDIIGIGIRKCGTGWLQHALKRHPMIKTNRKEGHFFNLRKNFDKGVEYYRSIMPNVSDYERTMEKTPGYFNYNKWPGDIPALMKSYVPNAKLWVILCDPVRRALSDFVQMTVMKEAPIPSTIDEYVDEYLPQAQDLLTREQDFNKAAFSWRRSDKASIILSLGVYYPMMQEWLKHYDTNDLHVISGDDMIRNPGTVLEKLQEFIGIPKMLLAEDFIRNPASGLYCIAPNVVIDSEVYKVPMQCMNAKNKGRTRASSFSANSSAGKALKKLEPFYKPYDDKLFRLLGRKLW